MSYSLTLSTSFRRRLLDRDLARATASLSGLVVDLGGTRRNRRGDFLPPQRPHLRWLYVNIDPSVAPDIVADAASVPLRVACADAVVCTEVLEHVPDPRRVLAEAGRLLRPGGRLIASMPFMSRVHAAPSDYQRYTAFKLKRLLAEAGFVDVDIGAQGLYFTVLADMIRGGLSRVRPAWLRWSLALIAMPILRWLVAREARAKPDGFFASHPAGHFVLARKEA